MRQRKTSHVFSCGPYTQTIKPSETVLTAFARFSIAVAQTVDLFLAVATWGNLVRELRLVSSLAS
jgi:hypothetical protein